MRYLIGLTFILILSACNMTTARQSEPQASVETIAVSTSTSVAVQATPVIAPTTVPTQQSVQQQSVQQQSLQQPAQQQVVQQQSAQTAPCTPRTDWDLYTVIAGDTLGGIAQRSASTVDELVRANCLTDANALSVGQTLRVPLLFLPDRMPQDGSATSGLRIVGQFNGRPGLEECWVTGRGTQALVYDTINGTAIAVLANRLIVMAATPAGDWVQVYLMGDKFTPDSSGWMRIADVSLIGACTEKTGVTLESWRGLTFGNPAGVPSHICAVTSLVHGESVPVYDAPPPIGYLVGYTGGWGRWISTEGQYHQAEFDVRGDPQRASPVNAWVDVNLTQKLNC